MNPKVHNQKLKEKSEVTTSITHAQQRSYKLHQSKQVKVHSLLTLVFEYWLFQAQPMFQYKVA